MQSKTRMLAIMAGMGVALTAGGVAAGEVKVINAGPAMDAVKVVKDKETGKLRAATAEEAAQMAARPATRLAPNVVVLSRPTTTIVTRPDGSATIRRSLEDLDSLVAVRRADGKLNVRHQQGKDAAAPSTPNLAKE